MTSPQARLLERIVAPASEPVSLSDAKQYLRVEHSADDTLIGQLIVTARQMAERYLRRSLITQTWKMSFGGVLESETRLAYGPVQSVTEITLIDADGAAATLSAALYRLNATKELVLTNDYFSADRTQITYVAGYGAAADVPGPIRQGMLMHLAALYDQRGVGDMPDAAIALYRAYKEMAL